MADEPDDEEFSLSGESFLELIDPEELVQVAVHHWREEQEEQPIELDLSLASALRLLPGVWLDALLIRIDRSPKGPKRQKLSRALDALTSPDQLQALVAELPTLSQTALREILAHEGWQYVWRLARDYGDDQRDGWFWNEEQPESPLGLLRVSGLLYVGRAQRGTKRQRVAVVPLELRAPLQALLTDEASLRPSRDRAQEALEQIRESINSYYQGYVGWSPPLERPWLEDCLRNIAQEVCADELWTIWNDLSLFLFFLEHFSHEITRLEELRDYHLSDLAHDFIEQKVSQQMGLKERRRLLANVGRLYAELATEHWIDRSCAEQVARSLTQICAGRQLARIARPEPLGGEVILQVGDDEGLVSFTLNDLWLLVMALVEFDGSLLKLRRATARAVGGGLKRRRIDWMVDQDLTPFNSVLAHLTPEIVEFSRQWFYEKPLTEERAW